MDKLFINILASHEREDNAMLLSEEALLHAVRCEFSNAETLISQAQKKGFSVSDFFSGKELPADIELPVRKTQSFYVKKHTAVQQPYTHSHEFYEFLYVQTGKCIQTLQNGRQIELKKGQCCLLCHGAVHRIERIGNGDVILKAVIPGELFTHALCDISLPNENIIVFDRMSLFAEYLFIRLLRESSMHSIYNRTAIQALLSLLLCELAREQSQEGCQPVQFYGDYFQTQLKQASLTHFARKYGYTPAYASRFVKQQTGKKFSELLSEYRLQRAAELLSSSDMSIEDIAFEVGYKVPSALYKHFNAHFEMTPNEYRNALGKR